MPRVADRVAAMSLDQEDTRDFVAPEVRAQQALRVAVDALGELPPSQGGVEHLARAVLQLLERGGEFPNASTSRARAIGALLRERRQAAGLGAETLAKRAGLAKNTVLSVEAGIRAPSSETLRRLCSVPELRLTHTDLDQAGLEDSSEWSPNHWVSPSYDAIGLSLEMVSALNGPGGPIEQTYLYLDGKSAADWVNLSSGGPFATAFRDACPLDQVAERVLRLSRGHGLDLNCLGPGDGRAESRLAQYIVDGRPAPPDVRVCLLDISPTMLNAAYRHAADLLERRGVAVFGLVGNFLELRRVPVMAYRAPGSERRRVYTLLGVTIANLNDELRWFRELTACAQSGDMLVLDVQVARAPAGDEAAIREAEPALRDGPPATHFEWLSGPILRYTRGAEAVRFRIDLHPFGAVPGSYELDWVAEVQLRGGGSREFMVLRGRRYDPEKLAGFVKSLGWESELVVRYGAGKAKTMAILLLRRV